VEPVIHQPLRDVALLDARRLEGTQVEDHLVGAAAAVLVYSTGVVILSRDAM